MPNASPAKTALARKNNETPFQGFSSRRAPAKPDARAALPSSSRQKGVLVTVGLTILALLSLPFLPGAAQALQCAQYRTPVNGSAQIGSHTVATESVATEELRAKGLGGRPCIKDNQAMLFVFNQGDISDHCFWMKGMRFPIDIVWLDGNKRVVYSVSGAEPSTYPARFCPGEPTPYVLELKSGQAAKLDLSIGARLSF